nr:hypothetical protein [Thermoplasmata archaeon]NIS22433.1 hypothetical protein [Thermoplasmata archaeon]NIT76951.1 hypothetical protein [Thermoplasmata archaeon]NIU51447.1 hypothetical protein [Thermoplasmata archaeon]NIV78534.1 hypothetical protein [Thermoplasmata archaeon]
MTLPTDGRFRIDVRVRDKVGNTATSFDFVVLDTTAPYITRFDVARGLAYTNSSTVPVVFGASDGLDDAVE